MMKAIKNRCLTLFAVLTATLLISAVVLLCTSRTAYANPTSENTIDFGTDGITLDHQSAINELIAVLGGTSYDDLSTNLGSPKDSTNFTEAKTVTLGGVTFNIMYVSKADYTANGTNEGDIIVTLWMAESDIESQWNPVESDTPEDKYPTNMYSSSLVRSTLVGTHYLTAAGATSLEGTGAINEKWQPFNDGGEFYDYLATPSNMAWQETLSAQSLLDSTSYNNSNEAWGTPSGGQFFEENYDYSSKEGYADWKNDRIWLPAISETGNSASGGNGLWKTNNTQRRNTGINWCRSASGLSARTAYFLDAPTGSGAALTTGLRAVRPAVHFNLKAAYEAAKPKYAEVTVNNATTKYTTVEEAFAYANEHSDPATPATVTMLADAQTQAALTVEEGKNITLDLNGCMLKYNNSVGNNSVIEVLGTFTLTDGNTQTKHNFNADETFGLWIFDDDGDRTLNGGVITGGNCLGIGGGVYVGGGGVCVRGGTFTMNGGSISGNIAGLGGGVCVGKNADKNGEFTMNGGSISGNIAGRGGGVCTSGAFTMAGGEICENVAWTLEFNDYFDGFGGGVCVVDAFAYGGDVLNVRSKGTFTMTDGTIIGNTATLGGGVCVGITIDYDGGTLIDGVLKVSGTPVITGNKETDGSDSNVYFQEGLQIAVTGALTEGAQIGVNNTGVVTSGYGEHNESVAPSAYFLSDVGGCIRLNDGNEAVVAPHDYATEFTIDKAATCTEAGSKSKHCSHCSAVTEVTEISALGHNYGEWTVVKEATETEEGEEQRVCANDNTHVESRVVPKIPSPQEPKNNLLWLWILLVCFTLTGIATVIYLTYRKKRKATANSADASAESQAEIHQEVVPTVKETEDTDNEK